MNFKKHLPSIILGNLFEWYDFSLYGYLVAVLGKLFFPEIKPSLAFIATFAIFATGFIARPIGSFVFGYYGDRLGRKATLSISILLMAFSTCLMGCLPTYASVGVVASVLLTVCRLMQGFAMGGEFTLSVTYLIEHANKNKRGLFGSFSMMGTFIGLLLGSLTIAILDSVFSNAELLRYGWRIPFWFSALLGVIGFFMRTQLPETPAFLDMQQTNTVMKNPVTHAVRYAYGKILAGIGMIGLGACSFALWFVWLPSYLHLHAGIQSSHLLLMNSMNLLIITALIPLVGYWSDCIGKKVILIAAAVGALLFTLPLLLWMQTFSMASIGGAQLGLAILASLAYGVVPIALFELFPAPIRCTGISLSYNVANMIFGGAVPLIASVIAMKTDHFMAQGVIILVVAAILMGVMCGQKHKT